MQDIIAQFRSGFLGAGIGPTAIARRAAAASSDWWTVAGQTCVAAYKAVGQVDLATSYVNLANPGTYNAAPGTAPGLAAGGWTFDGSTQYLKTGITPATDQTWTAIIRFADQSGDNRMLIGSTAGYEFQIRANSTAILATQRADVTLYSLTASNPGYGIAAMAGRATYFNGTDGATIGASTGSDAAPLYIGQRRNYSDNPSGGLYFLGTIAAIAIYSTTLSAADVAAQTVKMAALT